MRQTEMRRHKAGLRGRSERELETCMLQQKHTHIPWRQKSQEAGGEVRKSKKKLGGREGKEVGKEGKKSGCGRKGQRAGLKHQEGSRERSQHPASRLPCWWSL